MDEHWRTILERALQRYEANPDENSFGYLCRLVGNGPPDVSMEWVVVEARRLLTLAASESDAPNDLRRARQDFGQWINKLDKLPDDEF
jgi:hypothetical protein